MTNHKVEVNYTDLYAIYYVVIYEQQVYGAVVTPKPER